MKDFEREALLLHAGSDRFLRRVESSMEVIHKACDSADSWFVAFSGGKDSTVILSLVRKVLPDIDAIWQDDEFFLPETYEYMERLRSAGVRIQRASKRIVHTDWFIANEGSPITDDDAYAGYDGVFLGLRAQENSYRRLYLRKYGLLHRAQYLRGTAQGWRCNPIGWWGVDDVWAYILSEGLDYNKAYDRLSEIGVSLDKQRIGPYATERALGYGQLAILRKGWPAEYRRFIDKFPEAGAYS